MEENFETQNQFSLKFKKCLVALVVSEELKPASHGKGNLTTNISCDT